MADNTVFRPRSIEPVLADIRPRKSLISVRGLRKSFGAFVAVQDFSLEVGENEIVSLLGPSGCGKTTTLRCLAGLESPTGGEIEIQGRLVYSSQKNINIRPEARNLSMVFQQYALWPHLSVYENVAFGLRVRRTPAAILEQKVKSVLDRVRLWEKKDHRISQLSGGQQQRIALARALSIDPQIVLFDEPLSNLDAKLRTDLRLEILKLQRELGFSAIFVTHDQDEAISLSSKIVIMNQGKCEQIGSPVEIWREPATGFVARFTGSSNSFDGTVLELNDRQGSMLLSVGNDLKLSVPISGDFKRGDAVEVFVRISDVQIAGSEMEGDVNSWRGSVRLVSFEGDSSLIEVAIGKDTIFLRRNSANCPAEGDRVRVIIPRSSIRVYRKPNAQA